MKLSELVSDCEVLARIGEDVEVAALSCDTRKCDPNSLFVCLRGKKVDTHGLWKDAYASGAVALLVEHAIKDCPIAQVVVRDTRAAMGLVASAFFGDPVKQLRVIAVVGTNGKTTTAYLIDHLLRAAGEKTCLIGTNGVRIAQEYMQCALTTPDPIDLHAIFAQAVCCGCKTVVMEVSAHAIALRKMSGIVCDIAVFTNLSQDHLDYFGDMASYAKTKASFFAPQFVKNAVINVDDELGESIARLCDLPVTTYGIHAPADVFSLKYTPSEQGSVFVVNLDDELCDIASNLHGRYNVYNTLAALSCVSLCGQSLSQMGRALLSLPQVPGRYQVFYCHGATVIVDYAHTPDGVENVLRSTLEWATGRLIAVLGCGGDRDAEKRPVMARIAEAYSDKVILTSDNPRGEDPAVIIAQMKVGLTDQQGALCIIDRASAIRRAIGMAQENDVVAILGKGSEPYIERNGVRYPYCDLDVVAQVIAEEADNLEWTGITP